MLRLFRLGPLAPYPTWLRVEFRTGYLFRIFFIARSFQRISPSAAAFRRFCAAFFTVTLTRR